MRDELLTTAAFPAKPDLSALPPFVDRRTAAALITQYYYPVAARTLEAWPMGCLIVNGKAVAPPAEYFAVAQARLAEVLAEREA